MSLALLEQGASLSNVSCRRRTETRIQFLSRAVQVHLSEKGLTSIENMEACKNIVRLYLYDNEITSIQNLEHCVQLRQLFLQNNQIENLEGVCSLKNLTILHLAKNKIKRLEAGAFLGLSKLETLHLEHQNLQGEKLLLSEGCFAGLDELTTLVISENRISGIEQVSTIPNLSNLSICSCGISNEQWPVRIRKRNRNRK